MRILDARYSRDIRRYQLAMRLMGFEARTQTIRRYTGLSRSRIQALGRSDYPQSAGVAPIRHRGPAPYRLEALLGDARSRADCHLVASLAFLLSDSAEIIAVNDVRDDPLRAGECLCHLFESYLQIALSPRLSFEQVVLVHSALAKRKRLATRTCAHCGSLILQDLQEIERLTCSYCASLPLVTKRAIYVAQQMPLQEAAEPASPGYQHKLF